MISKWLLTYWNIRLSRMEGKVRSYMPIYSISENNERLLLNCRAKKMYKILNKHVKFLTSQYIGTCKSAYTKGYALN